MSLAESPIALILDLPGEKESPWRFSKEKRPKMICESFKRIDTQA